MIWGALVGGFVGTLVLTTLLRAASEFGLTRMDLPFLLGTAVTADRVRAKALGYLLHFAFGLLFALAYYAVFLVIDTSGFLLGAVFGWMLYGLWRSPRSTPVVLSAGAALTALAFLASVGNALSFTPVTAES